MLYAHTPNESGEWHSLDTHLLAVANKAAKFAETFGAGDVARLLGLWHDLGKASDDFQRYLAQCAAEPGKRFQSVDHKGAGTLEALAFLGPLALIIDGHHGGLSNQGALRSTIKALREAPFSVRIANALQRAASEQLPLPKLRPGQPLSLPPFINNPSELELFVRLLFSCLVDADHLDTEAHRNPEDAAIRREPPSLTTLLERLELAQATLTGKHDDPVNIVRHEVYQACLSAATHEPGLFRLTVPTGGGKTRSALAFALRHAVEHGLHRVIVVSPYLTITDQTADVYRSVLGNDVVLEHHSDAGRHDDPDGAASSEAEWRRLAAQNWDAAIVVTTAVQFFESLFSNRTMACRKLHSIAGSAVILDEPQTLPAPMLDPIADSLRQLVQHYGTTVILCTATQPAFDAVPAFTSLPDAIEIAPEPLSLFQTLKRVEYEWPAHGETWSWEVAADALREEEQALCIVNTRPDALALLDALGDPEALHLSTLLCGAHRREVLEVIRGRLGRSLPCRVVSTQVVEAGVDLDFPVVFRALGPLDRIAQAAGRCNREGKLVSGRVVVFRPDAGGVPSGAYRTATDLTDIALAAGNADPNDPQTFDRYFRSLYSSVAVDAKAIQDKRRAFAYEAVASAFRMIPDDSVSALVTYRGLSAPNNQYVMKEVDHAATVDEIEHELRRRIEWGAGFASRTLMECAQPYLVNLRQGMIERQLSRQGLVGEIAPELWRWLGAYDEVVGIGRMDASVWNTEDFVIA